MTAIISAAVIFVVFAVGDMISAKTKAIVSMLLVASVASGPAFSPPPCLLTPPS